jgi:hypothetical protein
MPMRLFAAVLLLSVLWVAPLRAQEGKNFRDCDAVGFRVAQGL